jgi:hypothetical protein
MGSRTKIHGIILVLMGVASLAATFLGWPDMTPFTKGAIVGGSGVFLFYAGIDVIQASSRRHGP